MLSYPKIKFCGLTNNEDVACAYEQKAYWAGFIFEKGSSRYIEFEKSKNIIAQFKDKIKFVGVFVNPSNDHIKMAIKAGIDNIQLHGQETPKRCKEIKNIFDTKIASKLCRTYTQNHGLKDLVLNFRCIRQQTLQNRLPHLHWYPLA